ncbi:hypothetical protein HUJ05_013129 [Dendroctonus ponderosae]|nr:hypothetical protein HUJ05_013129 [Dendroctonus ponderosae]
MAFFSTSLYSFLHQMLKYFGRQCLSKLTLATDDLTLSHAISVTAPLKFVYVLNDFVVHRRSSHCM